MRPQPIHSLGQRLSLLPATNWFGVMLLTRQWNGFPGVGFLTTVTSLRLLRSELSVLTKVLLAPAGRNIASVTPGISLQLTLRLLRSSGGLTFGLTAVPTRCARLGGPSGAGGAGNIMARTIMVLPEVIGCANTAVAPSAKVLAATSDMASRCVAEVPLKVFLIVNPSFPCIWC